jgi:hypothetical protein
MTPDVPRVKGMVWWRVAFGGVLWSGLLYWMFFS